MYYNTYLIFSIRALRRTEDTMRIAKKDLEAGPLFAQQFA